MNLNVIIDTYSIDYNKLILNALKQSIENIQEVSYEKIEKPIVIFKEINNYDELKDFHHNKYHHIVIFIVNSSELMFESLKQYPLSFIRKDNLKEDLDKVIQLILDIHKNLEQVLTLKVGYSYIQTKASQITYIESYGHYLIIYTLSGQYKVRNQLKEVLSKANKQDFIQIHKSYIVNKNYIKERRPNEIVLKFNITLPIGRKYNKVI